ncbi:MAG: UvrD-helicase domain-containing protein [Chitinophagales bacterium]|nr:UvrD-helicase domain-containing protein [Chitinophagales bacterium]
MEIDFLAELNEPQRLAVTQTQGPVMIIAGPGSGKTRVLTYRIAYLIKMGVDPFKILSLTFTNKAAQEMRERISQVVGSEARNLFMGTFHSVFARILRIEAEKLGYPRNFTIYDTDDAKSLLKSIIKEEGLNDKLYKPANIFYRISSAKNSLIGPAAYANNVDFISDDESAGRPKTAELYAKYANRCFLAGAMDFDDLLFKMHELLVKFPEVLYKYQHKFSHLLIDEFQDTNSAQYDIVQRLSAVHENVCVVGDDAQSIYAFRGATIQNILNFERDYPDLRVFKLEQNYRSTEFIVNAANQIIKNNSNQIAKTIWTEKNDGEKIKIFKTASESDEGRLIANLIFEQKMRNHWLNQDFAILYRTNSQSRALEEALRKLNIPYRIYGGTSFYQRKEVKDFIAYMRVISNPKDEEALKRIINYPARGISDNTVNTIIVKAQEKECSLWEICENPEITQLPGRALSSIYAFVMLVKSFRAELKEKDAYQMAMEIGRKTGLVEDLYKDKTVEGLGRYENIQELLNGVKDYTTQESQEYEEDEVQPESDLAAYLQQISLLTDMDNNKEGSNEKVKLMTVHAAKGLEFPSVFVVGMEENLFPSAMSMSSREDIEEERRLFYVAITRAKEKLTISYALTRYKFGQMNYQDPSRFIEEIGVDNAEYFGKTAKVEPKIESNWGNKWDENRGNSIFDKPLNENKTPLTKLNVPPLKKVATVQKSHVVISTDLKDLKEGVMVLHEKFDKGTVTMMEGVGENKIATILFDDFGQKKIMLKFAKLKIIEI